MKHTRDDADRNGPDASILSQADAGETVSAAHLSGETGHAPEPVKAKICCVCGANVAGEKRYKDSLGRYWCCDCAKSDAQPKKSAACPDCGQAFAASDLVEFEKLHLCRGCVEKRQKQAKRAAARQAWVAEEAQRQHRHWVWMVASLAIVVALLVIYALYRIS